MRVIYHTDNIVSIWNLDLTKIYYCNTLSHFKLNFKI
jgi:hypothetical protein